MQETQAKPPSFSGIGQPDQKIGDLFVLVLQLRTVAIAGLPGSLAPGKRPRTTLSPSLALQDGQPRMVFGTPGGDQQDQWQLIFFLYHAEFGMGLQQALDAPLFHSTHFPPSFYPRSRSPGQIMVEETFGADVISDLKARGHDVQTAPHMTIGRLTAVARGARTESCAQVPLRG